MTPQRYILIIGLGIIGMQYACIRPPEYPIEPVLTYAGMSRNVLSQGLFNDDSLLVQMNFTDGDGDIGSDDSITLFFRDLRSDVIEPSYRLPLVPEAGASRGISGKISVVLYNTCCIFSDGTPPCNINPAQAVDTLRYEVFLKDRAGHQSLPLPLPPILLLCD